MIDKKKYPRLYEWLTIYDDEQKEYAEKYEFQILHENLLHSADVSFRKHFCGDNKEIHQIKKDSDEIN